MHMAGWSSGYVTEIDYSYGYYDELNPVRLPFALLGSGLAPSRIETACELGFGQGVSIAIHAAASPVQWWGTDFSPSQAGLAQALATASGSSAKLYDESFADFCARPGLPDFDFVAIHGIFCWVSDENRRLIVDFLRRRLRPGGVAYISYNALPGWAAFQPMRQLLVEHAALFGSAAQGIEKRLGAAMAFGQQLLATDPAYVQASPAVRQRLQDLAGFNSTYLAHELFGRDWVPMHFTDMQRWLEPAKLSFATSADYLEVLTPMLLSQAQQALLEGLPDTAFRELVTDFIVNRQFRRDYWVKGPRPAGPLATAEGLRDQAVVLTRPRAECTFRVEGAPREVSLEPGVYAPVLDALADHRPVSVGRLAERLGPGLPFESLCGTLRVLFATGAVRPAQDADAANRSRNSALRLNAALLERARSDGSIRHLACPATGGGVVVPRNEQLFLLARARAVPQESWADFAWQLIAAQGQDLVSSAEEYLRMLRDEAQGFAAVRLPALQALGVVPEAR